MHLRITFSFVYIIYCGSSEPFDEVLKTSRLRDRGLIFIQCCMNSSLRCGIGDGKVWPWCKVFSRTSQRFLMDSVIEMGDESD